MSLTNNIVTEYNLSLNESLYKDTFICKDNFIKFSNNKDTIEISHKDDNKDITDNQYQKLQVILIKQFGCHVSIEEATLIGKSLLNIYEILLD